MRGGSLSRALLALGVATLLAACSGKTERIASGLRKCEAFIGTADWDKAGVEVRNVLQIDPRNVPAHLAAARIDEARGELARAYAYYAKVLELQPASVPARLGMVRLQLMAGDSREAERGVTEVLAADPGNVVALTLHAALLAGRGDTVAALAQARALVAGGAAVPAETHLLLAGLYMRQGQPAQALAVMEAALKSLGPRLDLLKVAAQVAGEMRDDPAAARRAEALYRQAAALAPRDYAVWSDWATLYVARNDLDRAEHVLRDSIQAQPDDARRRVALLEFIASRRGLAVAEPAFKAEIAERPKDMPLRFGLASLYRSMGRADDAQQVLQAVVDLGRDDGAAVEARTRLAVLHLSAGRLREARALLDEVIKLNPHDNAALLLRARLLLADGKAQAAVLDLRTVVRDQPDSVEAVGLLAQAHRLGGEPRLAGDVVAEAVKFRPDSAELQLLLAAYRADARDWRAAQTAVDEAIRLAPTAVRAYDLKAQFALARGDAAGAEKTWQALKAQRPDDPVGALRLGQFYAGQNKPALALPQYDAAARLAPDAAEPRLLAVALLAAQQRFTEADARVAALARDRPDSPLPYQLRGELALVRRDLPAAQVAFEKTVALAPLAPAGYLNLARVAQAKNDLPGALQALQRGEKAVPADLSLPAARADALGRAGRHDEAIAVYESLLQRAPDNELYANNLAYLLAETRGDRAALERALQLTQRFAGSGDPSYLDSLGWVQFRLGQYAQAAAVLERALALSPGSPLLQLHLGMALMKQGDTARGRELVRRALQKDADLAGADEARRLIGA